MWDTVKVEVHSWSTSWEGIWWHSGEGFEINKSHFEFADLSLIPQDFFLSIIESFILLILELGSSSSSFSSNLFLSKSVEAFLGKKIVFIEGFLFSSEDFNFVIDGISNVFSGNCFEFVEESLDITLNSIKVGLVGLHDNLSFLSLDVQVGLECIFSS